MATRKPKKPCKDKAFVQMTAELLAELHDSQHPRGDALHAPVTFDEDDDLLRQSLPMHVVRRWFN